MCVVRVLPFWQVLLVVAERVDVCFVSFILLLSFVHVYWSGFLGWYLFSLIPEMAGCDFSLNGFDLRRRLLHADTGCAMRSGLADESKLCRGYPCSHANHATSVPSRCRENFPVPYQLLISLCLMENSFYPRKSIPNPFPLFCNSHARRWCCVCSGFVFALEPQGTVKSRLLSMSYTMPEAFAADVRLVFKNAIGFNPESHFVHTWAVQLLNEFDVSGCSGFVCFLCVGSFSSVDHRQQ